MILIYKYWNSTNCSIIRNISNKGENKVEEKLVAEYIGKDAENIMGENMNWSSAIAGQAIGPIWFFYRKAYLLGFAFLVISYLVGMLASAMELEEASYIMFIIYLAATNKVYLWDVRRKVKKIMSDSYMSEEQMLELARKKGGTSALAAIIYGVAFLALIALIIFSFFSLY